MRNMKKNKKRFLIVKVILALFLLDFVPIKYAIKIEYVEKNHSKTYDFYMCEYTATTFGDIKADPKYNKELSKPIIFYELKNNSPFKFLSKEYTTDYIEPSNNKYVFKGNIVCEVKDIGLVKSLKINNWDIVYPIKRKSLRGLYVPKGYLTIYDFNWIKVLKEKVI